MWCVLTQSIHQCIIQSKEHGTGNKFVIRDRYFLANWLKETCKGQSFILAEKHEAVRLPPEVHLLRAGENSTIELHREPRNYEK